MFQTDGFSIFSFGFSKVQFAPPNSGEMASNRGIFHDIDEAAGDDVKL